jgi:hypothetical protein
MYTVSLNYECNSVYFKWFSEYLVYQLREYSAIASKPVGGLVNYAIVYVVCEFVDLIKNIKWVKIPNKEFSTFSAFVLLTFKTSWPEHRKLKP